MTAVFLVGLAAAQAAPIGSALKAGIELVYESREVAQAPWVYDSVRVVERPDFDRCIVTQRRSQAARESCVRADTLFERGESNTYRAVRPIGPNMQLAVPTAAGDILHYTTGEVEIARVAEGVEVAVISTTIITRNPSGTVTRRLRERYAPALLTAVWGVFEEPDEAGGWTSVLEFSLIDVRSPVASPPKAETSRWAGCSEGVLCPPSRRASHLYRRHGSDRSRICRYRASSECPGTTRASSTTRLQ
jgi:hypothetical protein